MKKILFILHFPPPVHGSSIVGLSIKESKIINETFDCRYINLLVSRTMFETGKLSITKIFRFFRVWFELLKNLIWFKPDICYLALSTSSKAFYKDAFLVFWLRIFGVKVVYHLHNKGVSTYEGQLIDRLLYRFVFKNSKIILLSDKLYKDIKTFVKTSDVYICHNGIEDLAIDPKIETNDSIEPAKILFLSNLIETKGVTVLLEACKILNQKDLNFTCDFIGAEGDLSAAQFEEKVNQLGIEDRVRYLGKRYGKDKLEAFSNADIFAFPTYYNNECFPLVLLEAMSANLPIVSTFEGGIPDIVDMGKTGYLVPQKDAETLAEKLEILTKSPELRRQIGDAGRKKYEEEFTLDIFERKMTEILMSI